MSSTVAVWKEQRKVESFEIDMNGRLKAHMLFAYLLNSAWNHARDSEFGFEALSGRGLMWVLSKIQLSFANLPLWGDQVVIETWGKRIERFYALRDFVVSSAEGEKLCAATSAWMILDRKSYRPQKLEQIMKDFPWQPDRSEIEPNMRKVPEAAHARHCKDYCVAFSDIDVNKHATATRYLQWMLDSYPLDVLTSRTLVSAEISFLAEAVLGDPISAYTENNADEDLCSLRRSTDAQELCRGRIEWRHESEKDEFLQRPSS